MNSVAIVGLGLIGGSLALALRARFPSLRLVALDFSEVLGSPVLHELRMEALPIADAQGRRAVFASVDLVVLAAPVSAIVQLLPEAIEHARVVTDCGSTKRSITACVEGLAESARFVPGHPMAGLPDGGLVNARADLFVDRSWILCGDASAPDALARVEAMIAAVGAHAVHMPVVDHDRAVALTSHVPQLLASALAVLAARGGAEPAAGPAFASATRVAGGSEAMWGGIFNTNADAIAEALRALGAELEAVARGLDQEPSDPRPALEILSQARKLRSPR
ncbi:MAG TPA: prephenate dehydrogenase/arogenate dehydrogenase family protein [Polyangiaceae bacterium]|nr:prephenate dehydrogenase/arogenate dehydrogenase family protein [Polyangiaceae bacterium]